MVKDDSKEKIENEVKEKCDYDYKKYHHYRHHHNHSSHDALYGLSVIGALFYFLQNASTFSEVLWGIGKAIFWPAILMFKLLTSLQI